MDDRSYINTDQELPDLPASVLLALDQANTAFFIKSPDGRYRYVNACFAGAAGCEADRLLGRRDDEIFPPDVARQMRMADAQVIESGSTREDEIWLQGPQGRRCWSFHRHPVGNGRGGIVAVAGMATDISYRSAEGLPSDLHVNYLRRLIDSPLCAAFLKDESGRMVYVSESLIRRSAMTREQWLGKTVEDVFPPDVAAGMRANDRAVLDKDQPIEVVEDTTFEHGTRQYWMVVKFPLRDRDGHRYVGGFGVDISARLQMERTLRERTEHFILPTFGSKIGSHDRDLRDHTLFMSAGMAQLLGIGHEPVTWTREQWWDVIHPDDRERNKSSIAAHLEGATHNIDMQYRVRHRDGSYRWVWSLGVAQRDERGVPYRIVGALIDITDQKIIQVREQAQQRVTAVIAETQRRLLAERAEDEIFSVLLDAVVSLTASAFGFIAELHHAAREDRRSTVHAVSTLNAGGKAVALGAGAVPPQAVALLEEQLDEGLSIGTPVRIRIHDSGSGRWEWPDGGSSPQALLVLPFGGADEVLGVAVITDGPSGCDEATMTLLKPLLSECANVIVTQRHRRARRAAEDALRESEQRYRQLVDLSLDAIHVFQDDRFVFVNPAAVALFGARDEADLLSRSPWDFVEAHDLARVKARAERIIVHSQVAPVMEVRIRALDGTWKYVESIGRPVTFRGRPAVQTIVRDISERKLSRERELRSRRMESLGTLAGGVAHDFNNILAAILANIQSALKEVPADSNVALSLGQVKLASERAASLVRQVLSFSRAATEKRQPVALASVLREVLNLVRPTVPALVEIRTCLPDDLPCIMADSNQLHQVVVNLISNAVHAIGRQPGHIDIALTQVEVNANASAAEQSSREVCLRITDDGAGMDEYTRERMFDPFFTTRSPGAGVGLGLSIVHEVVRNHGGHVEVSSAPGRGTQFELYFPATQADLPPAQASTPAGAARKRRVLFLDDDALVNFAMHRVLSRAGHQVTAQLDPRQALALFRARPDDFDVLVVDLSMPGMSGLEFSRSARACRPDVPIVLSSGYFEPADEAAARDLAIRHLLSKPYDVESLEAALQTT